MQPNRTHNPRCRDCGNRDRPLGCKSRGRLTVSHIFSFRKCGDFSYDAETSAKKTAWLTRRRLLPDNKRARVVKRQADNGDWNALDDVPMEKHACRECLNRLSPRHCSNGALKIKSTNVSMICSDFDHDPGAARRDAEYHQHPTDDFSYLLNWREAQLCSIFPLLADTIFRTIDIPGNHTSLAQAVTDGVKLKEIANMAEIPMHLRKLSMEEAHALNAAQWRQVTCRDRDRGLPPPNRLRLWHSLLNRRDQGVTSELREWFRKNACELSQTEQGNAIVRTLLDWLVATRETVTQNTAVRTVLRRVDAWHQQLATRPWPGDYSFPEPPLPAQRLTHELEIVPLLDSAALREEGRQQHHCVASYANRLRAGARWIYSLRETRSSASVLTTYIGRAPGTPGGYRLLMVTGKFNRQPTTEERQLLRKWLRGELREPGITAEQKAMVRKFIWDTTSPALRYLIPQERPNADPWQ